MPPYILVAFYGKVQASGVNWHVYGSITLILRLSGNFKTDIFFKTWKKIHVFGTNRRFNGVIPHIGINTSGHSKRQNRYML